MANEKLPIKFFAPREIDELRVEAGGSSDIPTWVLTGDKLTERASVLSSAFSQFESSMTERAKRNSAVPFTFVAKMCETATAKSRRGGDTCENKNWVAHNGIKLLDAAVFPNSYGGIDEDELIANIKDAIASNYKNVKVWNLSISVTRPVRDDKFSDFAIALDDLQTKYNVLICKSAGNCLNFTSGHPKGRIQEGADSVRSLVVGSVAHAKGTFDYAEIDNPSPFSHVGPGPEYIIKPEVAHYGGNAGVDKHGKIVTTGVTSFSQNGNLVTDVGTSFSTPRISSLATGLYQELNVIMMST